LSHSSELLNVRLKVKGEWPRGHKSTPTWNTLYRY